MVKVSLTHAYFLKTLQKEEDPTLVINMGPKKIDMEIDSRNLTPAKCKELFFEIIRKLILRQIQNQNKALKKRTGGGGGGGSDTDEDEHLDLSPGRTTRRS